MSASINNPRAAFLRRAAGWMLAALIGSAAAPVAADPTPKTIAMMNFELIDNTGETAKDEEQKARLVLINQQLRAAFAENHLYTVVDNAPAAALIADLESRYALHNCNGCDVTIGRALNTDLVMTAWVQKVSNLILHINFQIRDVKNGFIILKNSVGIRGNTDETWSRGIRFMVRSMVEKNQANR